MYPAEVDKAGEVHDRCLENGLSLCRVHGDADGIRGHSIIIKPAFTILEHEVEELLDKLEKSLSEVEW